VTESFFEQSGVSVSYHEPLVLGGGFLGTLQDQLDSYRHESRATGGYYSARIRVKERQDVIEDWLQAGLGRHIVVNNEALDVSFVGFLNTINANLGPLTYKLGPLTDVGNRVRVVYSTVDNSVTPPVVGVRTTTADADDTDSQALYGIIEKVLSTGGSTATEAEQNRDTWLARNSYPPTSRDANVGRGAEPSMTLEILGYWHWLRLFTFSDTNSGTRQIDERIGDVLDAEPNGNIFSASRAKVADNTFAITRYDDDQKSGETILKSLVALGDTNDNRYNIGFYEDQIIVYEQAPLDYEYKLRLGDNLGVVDVLDSEVKPWDIRPGKWIFFPDFLTGRNLPATPTDLNRDPRVGYIETVQFNAPNDLRVNGVKLSELDQMLAKQGLAGIGA
jgi:hypothetical protein